MKLVKQVALTCITYDPTGGLLAAIKELKEELLNLNYDEKMYNN
ncbi:hypothetical protein BTJ45_04727 [Bacillus mycoides]|nr:hypothetical protein BTJ45_04727 [Bacillus mycoides]